MALLEILHYPDERLRTKAQPVTEFTPELKTLVENMFETMYDAPGIGLAATQVNVHQRIITIDISEKNNEPIVLINPEIIGHAGEQAIDEGCLSIPGIYEPVQRYAAVKVKCFDENGKEQQIDATDLLAVCIQHEMDHLDGKLFVDYLSEMKRQRIRKKLVKAQKRAS